MDNKIILKIEDKSVIYIIVAILGIILLFINILESRPIIVNIEDLGLISHLTIAYWLGYLLIIVFSIKLYLSGGQNDYIYMIYLVIIALYLFGIPVFAEENARFAWSYYPAGEVKSIMRSNTIGDISKFPLGSYRSWPTTHIISLYILRLTGLDTDNLIKYMPIYWIISVALISYSTGKFIFSSEKSFMVSIFVMSSFWTINYYYGPQSLAYILFLLFLGSIILLYKINDEQNRNYNIVYMVLIFFVTVTTHILTTIAMITSFILSSKYIRQISENRMKLIILFLVVYVGWYIYVAEIMFNLGITELAKQIINEEFFGTFRGEKYDVGTNLLRQMTHYSRFSYLLLYVVLMLGALISYKMGKVKIENRMLLKILFLYLIGIVVLLALRYGAEIDDRVYILSLLPMALIIALIYDKRIVAVLSIILFALHMPAHYGQESFDNVYSTELQGSKFLSSYGDPRGAVNYYFIPLILYYDTRFNSVGFKEGYYNPDQQSINESDYIISSQEMSNMLIYNFGKDKIKELIESNDIQILLYDNGYYKIFKREL